MKISKSATFYYNQIPEPCCVITIAEGRIIAKNLLTGVAFIANPDLIDVRPRYSRDMMSYIRRCKTPPSRKQIMQKFGFNRVTVCRAFKAAEPEIKNIYALK